MARTKGRSTNSRGFIRWGAPGRAAVSWRFRTTSFLGCWLAPGGHRFRSVEGRRGDLLPIFRFTEIFVVLPPNHLYNLRRPVPQEGCFMTVANVGRGMRWTRHCRHALWRVDGRQVAYGEVVWS